MATFKMVSGLILTVILASVSLTSAEQCSCPLQKNPVCGTDGQTYPNKCLLDCSNAILDTQVTVAKTDSCQTGVCSCEKENNLIETVCGTDGLTYRNVCELRCARQKDKNLEVFNQGPCMKRLKRNRRSGYDIRYKFIDDQNDPNNCGIRFGK